MHTPKKTDSKDDLITVVCRNERPEFTLSFAVPSTTTLGHLRDRVDMILNLKKNSANFTGHGESQMSQPLAEMGKGGQTIKFTVKIGESFTTVNASDLVITLLAHLI